MWTCKSMSGHICKSYCNQVFLNCFKGLRCINWLVQPELRHLLWSVVVWDGNEPGNIGTFKHFNFASVICRGSGNWLCVNKQVMTPNQDILMRFEWHAMTLIPIICQLPSARLVFVCWHWSVPAMLCRALGSSVSSRQPFCSHWKDIQTASPTLPLGVMTRCRCCGVGVTQTQSAQGGTCCEASAEVSCEIQLCSGQSLIDNWLWQPALRTVWSLLEPWIVFRCLLVNKRGWCVQ